MVRWREVLRVIVKRGCISLKRLCPDPLNNAVLFKLALCPESAIAVSLVSPTTKALWNVATPLFYSLSSPA